MQDGPWPFLLFRASPEPAIPPRPHAADQRGLASHVVQGQQHPTGTGFEERHVVSPKWLDRWQNAGARYAIGLGPGGVIADDVGCSRRSAVASSSSVAQKDLTLAVALGRPSGRYG